MKMTTKKYYITHIILLIVGLGLLFEIARDSFRKGDFMGYVNAGNLVIEHKNIYLDPLNTWPPFFSVFSVPIALGDHVSNFLIRFLWLIGSLIAMYFIVNVTLKMSLNKTLDFYKKRDGIKLQDTIFLVPALIILRFILDNLSNLQINIYMLLLACFSVYFFMNKKNALAGFLLALSISLKAYTIFILFYFLYKREFLFSLWTLIFLLLINSTTILVFGFDQAIAYYRYFVSEIASPLPTAHHKNQSILGCMLRLCTTENPQGGIYLNFLTLKSSVVKHLYYVFILVLSFYPAFIFRKKLDDKKGLKSVLEYSFVFSAIPLLSPLSWKAYFIFLWFSYLLSYILLFKVQHTVSKKVTLFLKYLFIISILLTVFSTQSVLGFYISDILETASVITIGTILLLIIQIVLYKNIEKFDLNSIHYE